MVSSPQNFLFRSFSLTEVSSMSVATEEVSGAGITPKERRMQQKVTQLCCDRPDVWSEKEAVQLHAKLQAKIARSTQHPQCILLFGEYSEMQLRSVLGGKKFRREVHQGLGNRNLKFHEPTW
jgi:hypothetical protein